MYTHIVSVCVRAHSWRKLVNIVPLHIQTSKYLTIKVRFSKMHLYVQIFSFICIYLGKSWNSESDFPRFDLSNVCKLSYNRQVELASVVHYVLHDQICIHVFVKSIDINIKLVKVPHNVSIYSCIYKYAQTSR